MFAFVSNNIADFTGGAVKTTRAGSYRADRVSGAIEMSGTATAPNSLATHGFAPVPGAMTWCHARVGFIGSTLSAPQAAATADGALFFEARDAGGAIVCDFTILDGSLRLRAHGASIASSAGYSLTNLSSVSLYALDVRCDLSGGNIAVDAWIGAADGSAPPVLSIAVANSAAPKTNPAQLTWRAYDAADHSSHVVYQQISEVMVGDEDTRGLGLTDLMTFGAGTHAAWEGDPAGLAERATPPGSAPRRWAPK